VAGVAGHARRERLTGRRVLLLVTGRTDFVRCLVRRGMSGAHLRVTVTTRAGLGQPFGMGTMATEAGLAGVHADARRLALLDQMTMVAVAGLVSMRAEPRAGRRRFGRAARRSVGKAMAQRAVAHAVVVQLLSGLRTRVLDAALGRVTDGAALALDGSHLVAGQTMTGTASDLVLDHVAVVPRHATQLGPSARNVHTEPVAAARGRRFASRARQHDRDGDRHHEPAQAAFRRAAIRHGAALRPAGSRSSRARRRKAPPRGRPPSMPRHSAHRAPAAAAA